MEFKQELRDLEANLLEMTETDEIASLRKVISLTLEFYDQMTHTRRMEFYSEIRNAYLKIMKSQQVS